MTKEEYQEYLTSDRWLALREAKLVAADFRCQVCNEDGNILDVHHRCYDNLGEPTEFRDLVVLCRKCHRLFHRQPKEKTRQSDISTWMDPDQPREIIEKYYGEFTDEVMPILRGLEDALKQRDAEKMTDLLKRKIEIESKVSVIDLRGPPVGIL